MKCLAFVDIVANPITCISQLGLRICNSRPHSAGSKNALPPGIPDPAAELGAPIDLRYPAVYITRRGHEDIDEVVDPEFL